MQPASRPIRSNCGSLRRAEGRTCCIGFCRAGTAPCRQGVLRCSTAPHGVFLETCNWWIFLKWLTFQGMNRPPPRISKTFICTQLPSGKQTELWKITIFDGNINYKWPFSIAMLVYQRDPNSWMVYKRKIILKWMIWGYPLVNYITMENHHF